MLGILLVLLACGLLLGNILREKKVAPETIVPTSFLLAVGLSFFFWAFPFLEIMALFLTCAGAIILIDSILDIVIAKKSVKEWVIKMAVAVVALTLGILLLAIPDFRRFAGLILGIILIIYAVLTAIPEFASPTFPIPEPL